MHYILPEPAEYRPRCSRAEDERRRALVVLYRQRVSRDLDMWTGARLDRHARAELAESRRQSALSRERKRLIDARRTS